MLRHWDTQEVKHDNKDCYSFYFLLYHLKSDFFSFTPTFLNNLPNIQTFPLWVPFFPSSMWSVSWTCLLLICVWMVRVDICRRVTFCRHLVSYCETRASVLNLFSSQYFTSDSFLSSTLWNGHSTDPSLRVRCHLLLLRDSPNAKSYNWSHYYSLYGQASCTTKLEIM